MDGLPATQGDRRWCPTGHAPARPAPSGRTCARIGLSLNKLSVLSHVYRHGPTTAGAVAAAAHQRPQSLTRVFAELKRDGLISRIRDETDRRHQVLELTSAGRTALVADMVERDAWLALALAELTETEQEVFAWQVSSWTGSPTRSPTSPSSQGLGRNATPRQPISKDGRTRPGPSPLRRHDDRRGCRRPSGRR